MARRTLTRKQRRLLSRALIAYCAWVGLGLLLKSPEETEQSLAWLQVAQLVVAIGISYLAGELLKQDPQIVLRDDKPSTTSQRGSYLPLVIGRRRVGPIIGWVGNREIRQEVVGAAGSGFGGEDIEQDVYFESAWHQLILGPAYSLRGIQQNGKQVLTGVITSTSHPSGTTVSIGDEGEFIIYWGEPLQPKNGELRARINVHSRWPYCCYVYWTEKRLGAVPTWPLMEYDIESRPFSPCLLNSAPWLESTNQLTTVDFSIIDGVDGAEGTNYLTIGGDQRHLLTIGQYVEIEGNGAADGTYRVHSFAYDDEVGDVTQVFLQGTVSGLVNDQGQAKFISPIDNSGANAAHMLYQVLFSPAPHGQALPLRLFDINSLELVGQQLEEEGIAQSLIAKNGEQANAALVQIMQDAGIFLAFSNGKFVFKLIRSEQAVTRDLEADLILDPLPEIESNLGVTDKDRMIFVFADRLRNFRDLPITIDNDGKAQLAQHVSARKIPMPTVTDYTTGVVVADRRSQEELGERTRYVITANRESRKLFPGQVFSARSLFPHLTMRVAAIKVPDQLSGETRIQAIPDTYGAPAPSVILLDEGEGIPLSASPPSPDLAFAIIESPEIANPGSQRLIIPRIRASRDVGRAAIWLSRDGRTYTHKGIHTESHTGGELLENFSSASSVSRGPCVRVLGPDIDKVLDLTNDDYNFENGRQVIFLGDEILFLRRIEMLSEDTFRLIDLRGARLGTSLATHRAGSTVFICNSENIRRVPDILLQPQTEIYVKTQPITSVGVSLADVTPKKKFLTGVGRAIEQAPAVADASGWSDSSAEADHNALLAALRTSRALKEQ